MSSPDELAHVDAIPVRLSWNLVKLVNWALNAAGRDCGTVSRSRKYERQPHPLADLVYGGVAG